MSYRGLLRWEHSLKMYPFHNFIFLSLTLCTALCISHDVSFSPLWWSDEVAYGQLLKHIGTKDGGGFWKKGEDGSRSVNKTVTCFMCLGQYKQDRRGQMEKKVVRNGRINWERGGAASQGQTHMVCCSNLERIQSRWEGIDVYSSLTSTQYLSSEMFDRAAVGTKWRGPECCRAGTTQWRVKWRAAACV